MTALPLAVLGCGGIAKAYLSALPRVPGLRVVALVDPEPARRQPEAGGVTAGARPFADVHRLLAAVAAGELELAAALVLTPPDSHEALTVALLAAGIHVLCEKPLAPTAAAARRMVAAADRHQRVLMMGSKFRYTGDMLAARRLLDDGAIGELVLFENVFCANVDMTRRWNSVRAVAGGGVLIDNGSHSVDVARYLMGPIARVQAQLGVQIQPIEVEDTARLLFEAHGGAVGSVDLSWSLHKEVPYYVRLYGSRGILEVGWQGSRHKREGDRAWTGFGSGYDKVDAFRAQLADFAAVIAGTVLARITAADALASVQVIEAAYRSARERRWQEIDA